MKCLSDSWLGWKLRNCGVRLSKSGPDLFVQGLGFSEGLCVWCGDLNLHELMEHGDSGALDPTQVNHSENI